MDFVFTISEMAAYAERHAKLLPFLLAMLDEKQIFRDEKQTMLYLKSMDKILRFRSFREQFLGNSALTNESEEEKQERSKNQNKLD